MLKELWCDKNVLKDSTPFESEDKVFFLIPTMCDVQVNGYNGISLDDELTFDALERMKEDLFRDGVTQFVPTIITCDYQKMLTALINTREFMEKYPGVIPGIHLEGPFISKEKRGIHPLEYVRTMDQQSLDTILEYRDAIAYMTVDPVNLGHDLINILVRNGIRLSLGHTNCNHAQAVDFFSRGPKMATHLFNAMSKSPNGRNPMAVEAVLETERIYAGVIVDGVHVDFTMVYLAWRLLGKYFILTTDALAASGVRDPSSLPSFTFAGKKIINDPVRGCISEMGTLAGSRLTMLDGLRNLVLNCGLSLQDASYAACVAPRRALKIQPNDYFMILDSNFNIVKIFKSQLNNY